jgi:hypothetical protein
MGNPFRRNDQEPRTKEGSRVQRFKGSRVRVQGFKIETMKGSVAGPPCAECAPLKPEVGSAHPTTGIVTDEVVVVKQKDGFCLIFS